MKQLIAQFLLKYNECPLPGIGTLERSYSHAEIGSDGLYPPCSAIVLNQKETAIYQLVDYLGFYASTNRQEAETSLLDFCSTLKALKPGEKETLASLGNFYVDEEGRLFFNQTQLNPHFYQQMVAVKRIRSQQDEDKPEKTEEIIGVSMDTASVDVLDGQDAPARKSYWWIWAIAFVFTATCLIAYHFLGKHAGNATGNTQTIVPATAPNTYQNIP